MTLEEHVQVGGTDGWILVAFRRHLDYLGAPPEWYATTDNIRFETEGEWSKQMQFAHVFIDGGLAAATLDRVQEREDARCKSVFRLEVWGLADATAAALSRGR